jgi:anhydro-N-acetylmuramic acid kinase
MVAVATAFTAKSIADAYKRFLPQKVDEVILCGGGAHNRTLVKMLKKYAAPAKVMAMDKFGISADAKEAISFAILAAHTIKGIPNNVPSATGAKKPVVLGKVIYPQPATRNE